MSRSDRSGNRPVISSPHPHQEPHRPRAGRPQRRPARGVRGTAAPRPRVPDGERPVRTPPTPTPRQDLPDRRSRGVAAGGTGSGESSRATESVG
ncbi:hypothetical protein KPATCC21470_7309 [Kitasatospora purpeofusca]